MSKTNVKREKTRLWKYQWFSDADHVRRIATFKRAEKEAVKREIRRELDNLSTPKQAMRDLRCELLEAQALECWEKEEAARAQGLPYKCTCPDISSLSDEEIKKKAGLL